MWFVLQCGPPWKRSCLSNNHANRSLAQTNLVHKYCLDIRLFVLILKRFAMSPSACMRAIRIQKCKQCAEQQRRWFFVGIIECVRAKSGVIRCVRWTNLYIVHAYMRKTKQIKRLQKTNVLHIGWMVCAPNGEQTYEPCAAEIRPSIRVDELTRCNTIFTRTTLSNWYSCFVPRSAIIGHPPPPTTLTLDYSVQFAACRFVRTNIIQATYTNIDHYSPTTHLLLVLMLPSNDASHNTAQRTCVLCW